MPLLASECMDESASVYLNDAAKVRWTYAILLPYLRSAVGELQAELESNDLPSLYEIAVAIPVAVGETELQLPNDFVLPIYLDEQGAGETKFTKVNEVTWEPDTAPTSKLEAFSFRESKIRFIGATTPRTVRLRYLRSLNTVTNQSSIIELPNAKQFLAAQTAALASNFGGAATNRATMASNKAEYFKKLVISSLVKRLQDRPVRRRGYRWQAR